MSDDVVEPQENGKALRREWESAFSEHFWPKYPRKVGKAAALRSWRPLLKGLREIPAAEKLLGLILDGLDRDLDTEWAGRPNDKIPHPATWIHQRRWEDDR